VRELSDMRSLLSLFLLLSMWSFSSAGCGADEGEIGETTCNFENCSGCCDGSQCITSVTASNCGQSGSSCRTCDSGDICSAGACVAPVDCSQCQNSGCCIDGMQCAEGDSKQACGKGGDACTTCGSGEVCGSNNTCETTSCDSSTCSDGCCTANGECKKAGGVDQSKDVCGKNGAACEVCDSTDISCSSGACVPADATCLDFCTEGCCMGETCVPFLMQSNATCGKPNGTTPVACEVCTGANNCAQGACANGPAWVVTIVSATIADTDLDGASWDGFGGLPDPEVAGGLGGQPADDFLTPFESGTLSPAWNYTAGAYGQADLVANGLNLVFTDDDVIFDDDMGDCIFTITQADLDAGTKTQAACGPKVTALKIDFVLVQ
jgi:hypothetical protein